jgi:hypothetical protein
VQTPVKEKAMKRPIEMQNLTAKVREMCSMNPRMAAVLGINNMKPSPPLDLLNAKPNDIKNMKQQYNKKW